MYYRVRAIRSLIGLPRRLRETYYTLGLKRRGSVIYQRVSPGAAGQLMKIKELVNVQLVERALTSKQEKGLRKTKPGYIVEKARTE
jgi:large subunit ribosomal protein L30